MFDLIIIGSGPAGLAAAQEAREAGAGSVALVEADRRLGGECPNRGCVPTKAILRSTEVLELARRAREFGLKIPRAGFDFAAIMKRRKKIVDSLTGHNRIEDILASLKIELIRGRAVFTGPNSIEVDGKSFSAKKFIVAAGSETAIPPVEGLVETGFLTSENVVELKRPPKSLLIIGGGPIACEIAEFLHSFGTKVTIVEFAPHILSREDDEIAATVAESFVFRGMKISASSKVVSVSKKGNQIAATVTPSAGGPFRIIRAEAVMVAAGKKPALGKLGLERIQAQLDKHGAPVLDSFLRSTAPTVYFAGDAAGQMMFTHVAHEMGEVAALNAVKGDVRRWNPAVIPRGTFCVPEVGSVGLTEQEARAAGLEVVVGRAPFSACGRAATSGEPDGLVKIVADRRTGLIVGAHVCGQSAAELVHELALAIHARVPYRVLADMIHAYPSYSECIRAAAGAIA